MSITGLPKFLRQYCFNVSLVLGAAIIVFLYLTI
jgi:hypothetical protein